MLNNEINKKPYPKAQRSAGQTLIETLAAAFILTMGISAAVGLAVYSYNTSGNIVKQIIATGLAREGLEAVRNMRDTNWLQDTAQRSCYDYASNPVGLYTANCYPTWLNKMYCLKPGDTTGNSCSGSVSDAPNTFDYGFDYSTTSLWTLKKDNGSNNFGLNFNPINSGTTGFYGWSGGTCLNSNSGYCRKIIITNDTTDTPYNKDANLSLLKVQSEVWWVDTKCPKVADFSSASVTCRLELDTYLTNWKNF